MEKIRAGDLRVKVDQEDILWYDRKRVTIFALPWSFDKYVLTKSKLLVEQGFFNTREEEIKLYRITDVSYSQTLFERIGKTGSIKILSNDTSSPEIVLKHVKNAKQVKDVISKTIEEARNNAGVKTSEMVSNVDFGANCNCGNNYR